VLNRINKVIPSPEVSYLAHNQAYKGGGMEQRRRKSKSRDRPLVNIGDLKDLNAVHAEPKEPAGGAQNQPKGMEGRGTKYISCINTALYLNRIGKTGADQEGKRTTIN
jgi:hypothetical protein